MSGGVGILSVILQLPGLKPGEKLLLALMENFARKSGLAYASIETYAERLGTDPRTIQRRLRNLERRGFVVPEQRGGGRSKTATYRLNLQTDKPRQLATLSDTVKGDKSGAKPRQNMRGNGDKCGCKPRQLAAQVYSEYTDTRIQENDPSPSSRAPSDNGNGHGNRNADQRLVALAGKTRGRRLTHPEAEAFLQAVGEARAAGATDMLITHFISKTDTGGAPSSAPNAARDASRTLLDSYQDAVQLPEPSCTVQDRAYGDPSSARRCSTRRA
jgi:hypothetical protein